MCGIFVAFNPMGIPHLDPNRLRASTSLAHHRGPDYTGFFHDPNCFLGHTRLSIIGVEQAANQPFHFQSLSISYNGEVFNYVELRDELRGLGYSFDTTSDTEVVLKAFDCWGSACFQRFNGMWALAIYDKRAKSLIVSRDRFGQKPLFVACVDGTYFFASEAQQLLDHADRSVNYGLVQAFLKEGDYERNGETFFSGIQEFPKAHNFEVGPTSKAISNRYWDYPSSPPTRTTAGAFERFEELLGDAVRIRMRADVPFGLMLSGGVDSTMVAAMIRDFSDSAQRIPAFTYASEDRFDESGYSQTVADRLGFALTIGRQDSDPEAYIQRLKVLVARMGRGHSSPAIVAIDYLYESVAKSGIRVALDGQGADELLAGYKLFYVDIIVSQLLRGRWQQALLNLKALLSQSSQFDLGVASVLILYLRTNAPPWIRAAMRRLYGYEGLFRRCARAVHTPIVAAGRSAVRNSNAVNRHLQKQHSTGLENLLYYGDIVAMNNSVENRSPFMDHRLVEFCFSHDELLKVRDGREKFALRNLRHYARFEDVLERDKIGFLSDIKGPTKDRMCGILQNSPVLDWPIFSRATRKFVASERARSAKFERLLFRLFQVHLWNEIFVPS